MHASEVLFMVGNPSVIYTLYIHVFIYLILYNVVLYKVFDTVSTGLTDSTMASAQSHKEADDAGVDVEAHVDDVQVGKEGSMCLDDNTTRVAIHRI